jgi:HD-GYP domain-containing protein (c-di-GMP phosphodiesterase class II)
VRSKQITEYQEVGFTTLIGGKTVTFDIYFYFRANSHLMLWRKSGDVLPGDLLAKYVERGAHSIWIHRDDLAAYQAYLGVETTSEKPTEEGRKIVEALQAFAEGKKEDEVAQVVSEQAQKALSSVAAANSLEAQAEADEHARKIVEDVLSSALDETESLLAELWDLTGIDPELEHAANVATYAVLFAMGFGKIDSALLADLALAGMLHDIGLTQVPHEVASKPWKDFTPALLKEYAGHVQKGLGLLDQFSVTVPERVKVMIRQHHEKFDGSGYPAQLQAFHIDDIAQLLGMADVMDTVAHGRWDGTSRTLAATLQVLEKLEKSRTYPEYFNPEIFAAVIRWTRSDDFKISTGIAANEVKDQAQTLIENEAAEKKAS